MHKSIIQDLNRRVCYLCEQEGVVEAHHCIHGTANRKLADEDGLIVNLCIRCHRRLHDRGEGDEKLKTTAQLVWMSYYMRGVEDFRARYGRSYL